MTPRSPGRTLDPLADPAKLTPHPFALLHFPLGDVADDLELLESIRALGVQRALTVTGERCASPAGTVLNGNRRCRAAVAARVQVPVRVLDDLAAIDEERIVLGENLGDQLGRRIPESRRAELERELAQRLGKGQGHRSDLATSAATGGSSGGDTREKVAAAVGSSRHAVDDRRAIFYSPIAVDALKDAVDAGQVSRTRAAEIIRAAEAEYTTSSAPNAIRDAQAHVKAETRRALEPQTKKVKKATDDQTRAASEPTAGMPADALRIVQHLHRTAASCWLLTRALSLSFARTHRILAVLSESGIVRTDGRLAAVHGSWGDATRNGKEAAIKSGRVDCLYVLVDGLVFAKLPQLTFPEPPAPITVALTSAPSIVKIPSGRYTVTLTEIDDVATVVLAPCL